MTARNRVLAAAVALGLLLALVGGIALVASYWHARALAHAYRSPLEGVPDLSAWLPLTTDGLLFAAFAVIYWRRLAQLDVPLLAWIGAGLAGVSTVAANLATAHPSVTGWIVAGWAPVTFTFVDFLAALLIPPLVKAWRDARDDEPWPLPEPTAVAPSRRPSERDGRDRDERDADISALRDVLARDGQRVDDVSPTDVPDPDDEPDDLPAVSTLRPSIRPDDPIPATEAEAVARLQDEINTGKLPGKPSARSLRTRWGFNAQKAKRIIDQLKERAS